MFEEMNNAQVAVADLEEMRIDLRSEDVVGVYLLITFDVKPPDPYEAGWHFKEFEAGMALPHLLKNCMDDHMDWPIQNPPDDESRKSKLILPGG